MGNDLWIIYGWFMGNLWVMIYGWSKKGFMGIGKIMNLI